MNLNRLRAEAVVALAAARLEEASASTLALDALLEDLEDGPVRDGTKAAWHLLLERESAARAAHAAALEVAEELGR